MPLTIYQSRSTPRQSELEILSIIIKDLKERYDNSNEFCYLFVDYECPSKAESRQIDATLIKRDAIINIEIKDASAHKVVVTPQLDLIEKPREKRLFDERGGTPLNQIKDQNFAIKNFIFEKREELFDEPSNVKTDHIDVCGVLVLRKIKEVDTRNLGSKNSFFRVTDAEKFKNAILDYHGWDFVKRDQWMSLDTGFVENLAKLLDLKQVKDLNVVEHIDTEFELRIRDYLYGIKFNVDYVDRPNIENKLLAEKNILAIGAPGAGKSTTLNKIVRDCAKQELDKRQFTRIPCLLKMGRVIPNELLKEIAREIGLTDEQVVQKLNEGLFWIVFDAVDEMQNFQENFHHVINFVKDYPKNRYLISIRREKYQHLKDDEDFEQLSKSRRFKEFVEVEIPPLTKEQQVELVLKRLGDRKSIEGQGIIGLFLAKLPEVLPLQTEMAVEIYLNNGVLVYENQGRYFEEFFKAQLKRESEKPQTKGRDTDVLLDNVLTKIGKHDIEKCDSYYEKTLVHRFLKEELGDNFLEFYDLLLKSEILELIKVTITVGKIKRNDEQLQFHHKSYRDFYVAKALIGGRTDNNWLEDMLDDSDEYRALVMLCGIEKDTVIVDKIIKAAIVKNNMELACECLFNAGNYSSEIQGYVAKEIIRRSEEDNNFKNNMLIELVLKYGERILMLELHKYLDSLENKDIIQRIDWEVYKSERLGFGEIPEIYQHTIRYSYVYQNIKPVNFTNSNWDWNSDDIYNALAQCPELQNKEIYQRLIQVTTIEELLSVLLSIIVDDTYSDEAIAWVIKPLEAACGAGIISQQEIINRIVGSNKLFNSSCEQFKTALLSFLLLDYANKEYDYVLKDINIAIMLIKLFWHETSPFIQLRILYHACSQPESVGRNFCIDVLSKYNNSYLVQTIQLIDRFIYDEQKEDWEPEYGPPAMNCAGKLSCYDFENETFETLLKCYAINNLITIDGIQNKDIIERFLLSENEKIRDVAMYALTEIEKQTSTT